MSFLQNSEIFERVLQIISAQRAKSNAKSEQFWFFSTIKASKTSRSTTNQMKIYVDKCVEFNYILNAENRDPTLQSMCAQYTKLSTQRRGKNTRQSRPDG